MRTRLVNIRLKPNSMPVVTDHAVLRYIERIEKRDIESLRQKIGKHCERGVMEGAKAVIVNGCRIVLEGRHAVTVLDHHQRADYSGSKRRLKSFAELASV